MQFKVKDELLGSRLEELCCLSSSHWRTKVAASLFSHQLGRISEGWRWCSGRVHRINDYLLIIHNNLYLERISDAEDNFQHQISSQDRETKHEACCHHKE